MLGEPTAYNPTSGLVAGQWYRALILGSAFDFWMSRKVGKAEARRAALAFAGQDVYADDDIDSVRQLTQHK